MKQAMQRKSKNRDSKNIIVVPPHSSSNLTGKNFTPTSWLNCQSRDKQNKMKFNQISISISQYNKHVNHPRNETKTNHDNNRLMQNLVHSHKQILRVTVKSNMRIAPIFLKKCVTFYNLLGMKYWKN